MKKYSSVIASVILTLLAFQVQASESFSLDLKPSKKAQCEPANPNASNQFACCVELAQRIELDAQNVLHLTADPALCLNPGLQDLQFSLVNARADGINIYELSSPKLEQTPFKSYSGSSARFWLAINSFFELPEKIYATDGVQSFIVAPLRIEKVKADGSTGVMFSADLYSTLGWKYEGSVQLAERTETYDCSNRFQPVMTCSRTILTIEENWLNQLTGELKKVTREVKSR